MITIKDWCIENMTGYKPKTSFYRDFSMAEIFGGVKGIKGTYRIAKKEWKNNVEYFTELVMVLNWKIWEHYPLNETYAKVYNELWMEADDYAKKHFKGEDLSYFYETTD